MLLFFFNIVIAEDFEVDVESDEKPKSFNLFDGIGCHTDFSLEMRTE